MKEFILKGVWWSRQCLRRWFTNGSIG